MSDDYDDSNNFIELAAYAARGKFKNEDDPEIAQTDLEDDPEVRANKTRLEVEIDRASSVRIRLDAPGYDVLIKSRNAKLAATRKLHNIVAVGEEPEDFIAPKPATGFAVVSKGRKRPATTPAPADPVSTPTSASAKPASWLWGSK
jgi:hypothetical protein